MAPARRQTAMGARHEAACGERRWAAGCSGGRAASGEARRAVAPTDFRGRKVSLRTFRSRRRRRTTKRTWRGRLVGTGGGPPGSPAPSGRRQSAGEIQVDPAREPCNLFGSREPCPRPRPAPRREDGAQGGAQGVARLITWRVASDGRRCRLGASSSSGMRSSRSTSRMRRMSARSRRRLSPRAPPHRRAPHRPHRRPTLAQVQALKPKMALLRQRSSGIGRSLAPPNGAAPAAATSGASASSGCAARAQPTPRAQPSAALVRRRRRQCLRSAPAPPAALAQRRGRAGGGGDWSSSSEAGRLPTAASLSAG